MKHIKRAAALVLAVMLSLCLSLTAFAASGDVQKTGTLTVTGSGLWIPGEGSNAGISKKVTAIRMFTARITEGENGTDDFDSYTLDKEWKDFFTKDASRFSAVKKAGDIIDETVTADNIADSELSDAVVAYIKTLTKGNDDSGLAALAHDAQKWAREHTADLKLLTSNAAATSAKDQNDVTMGVATFENLTAGYYLVYPEGGSTGNNNRATDAIFANVPKTGAQTNVKIKSTCRGLPGLMCAAAHSGLYHRSPHQIAAAVVSAHCGYPGCGGPVCELAYRSSRGYTAPAWLSSGRFPVEYP